VAEAAAVTIGVWDIWANVGTTPAPSSSNAAQKNRVMFLITAARLPEVPWHFVCNNL
jgi:hypothetical protein